MGADWRARAAGAGGRVRAGAGERTRRIVAGSLYVALTVALATVAAWPIYRLGSFLILVTASALLGAGIATLVTWRRLGGWAVVGLLAAVMLVAGVPLAVPSRMGGATSFVRGVGELGAGLVVGWKDLLTVDLPVGSYRNLLVPALVVFLVGTTLALLFAWRRDGWSAAAVPVAVAMTGFGLLFGRTEVSAPLSLGPLQLPAPVETTVGIGTLGAGVLWLSWRSRDARVRALRTAAASSGVRLRRLRTADLRRAGLGVGMVAVAAVFALAVPAAASSASRTVLREATGPRVEISQAVSPLVAYRSLFSDARLEQVLFSATGQQLPERIRLAVLDDYDGAVFRTAADGDEFVRVASARTPAAGTPIDVDISIGALQGIWMPTAGTLASASFTGSRAAALADGFYIDDELSAAVQIAGWHDGDGYRLEASDVAGDSLLAEAEAPGGDLGSETATPASVRTWMQEHVSGTGGAALEGLVSLLRERGYLSHALTETDSAWMQAAGVDTFVPSTAGHSLARIDQLFTALLEREQDPRAEASDNFVAAIGDDEQFAVAVSLMARELGFPSRVVVGARLSSSDPSLPVCTDGACRSADIAAWVEVRAASGQWIAVDVTPQHTQSPSHEVTAQPDPTIGTEVRPDIVEEVDPPKPGQEDAAASADRPDELDLSVLWAVLKITGVALGGALLVVGPFLLIVAAKALRRRGRRGAEAPADRIAGGWEEYLDAAVDARRRPPVSATRVEIADALDRPAAEELARGADEAVFSAGTTTDDEASAFWRIVDAERAGFATGPWQRLRAAVSLRSFFPGGLLRRTPSHAERSHTARSHAERSHTERGSRAGTDARRTT
ncbi:MAG: transglutaminase [Microbacterium sp. SCN 70-200]|uniref:transglutaminase-like domain-containing protein n=1 Tax=unclassified Microbacterium TaxID=2609290 RepID=UPI0008697B7F|nr:MULTISPECIES: transglutaminase-like domain-containing protein [unclassified Microbacterium]ODT39264.1 MAG: transglutaminase [Microbacterium sp. SCN 70-200]OJV85815.1 MAG: transglutaminase [Microbacterium sp. 70-16]